MADSESALKTTWMSTPQNVWGTILVHFGDSSFCSDLNKVRSTLGKPWGLLPGVPRRVPPKVPWGGTLGVLQRVVSHGPMILHGTVVGWLLQGRSKAVPRPFQGRSKTAPRPLQLRTLKSIRIEKCAHNIQILLITRQIRWQIRNQR